MAKIFENIITWLKGHDIFMALVIVLSSVVVSFAVKFIINNVAKRIAKKTKSDLDDKIIHALENPIVITIIIAGVFASMMTVSTLELYRAGIYKAAQVVGTLIATYTIVKIINVVFRHNKKNGLTIADKKIDMRYSNTLRRVVNIAIYFIAGTLILSQLGVEITPLIASLGIGGLAVALALQDTLANFFSGFYVISERQIGIGDYVELQSENIIGEIDDIGWRTTRIKNFNNNFVVIPNSKLAQAIVTNYTKPDLEYTMPIPVGVAYDTDLEKAEKIALDTAIRIQKSEEIAVPDFEPWLTYKEFGESSINFNVGIRAKNFIDRFKLRHIYIKELKKEFNKNGVEIAFPTRTVYLKK